MGKNQQPELVIHRLNGQIHENDSHDIDPFPPRG